MDEQRKKIDNVNLLRFRLTVLFFLSNPTVRCMLYRDSIGDSLQNRVWKPEKLQQKGLSIE